ncbi:MAG: anti-sigma factor antagonist [Clostridia bacterium]|nr:anti-sigma factor antagonist [Clostridia bacterium]
MLCFERRGRRLIAYIEGELDHDSTAIIRAEIDNQLRDHSINDLVIDMAGVSFMDSSGIGLILGRYRIMAARGGEIHISRPGKRTDKMLMLAGVYELVNTSSNGGKYGNI